MMFDSLGWYDFWQYLSSPLEREIWDRYAAHPRATSSGDTGFSHVEMVPITWTSAENTAWPPTDNRTIFFHNGRREGRTSRCEEHPIDAQTQQIGLEGRLFDVRTDQFATEILVNIKVTTAVEKYGRDTPVTLLTGKKDAPFHRGVLSVNGEEGIRTWFARPDSIIYRIALQNGAGTPHHPRTPAILRLDYDAFYLGGIDLPAGLGRELFKDHHNLSGPVDTGTTFYETESPGSLAKKIVSRFRGQETRNLNDPRNGLRFIRHLARSICTW